MHTWFPRFDSVIYCLAPAEPQSLLELKLVQEGPGRCVSRQFGNHIEPRLSDKSVESLG